MYNIISGCCCCCRRRRRCRRCRRRRCLLNTSWCYNTTVKEWWCYVLVHAPYLLLVRAGIISSFHLAVLKDSHRFLYQFIVTGVQCFVWHPGIQKALKTGSVQEQIYLKSVSSNSGDGTLFLQNHIWYYYQLKPLPVKSYILCYSHLHSVTYLALSFIYP